MKKSTRKFAVINRQRSNDKFILPMNLDALRHILSLDSEVGEDICLEQINIGYSSSDSYKPLLRMAKNTRWTDVLTVRNRENYSYYGSYRYMRLIDVDVKITERLFEWMQSYTNLKWIEEDNKQFILVDESMIPEGMTESFVKKNKLVGKDDTQEIYGDASIMSYHYSQWHPEVEKQFTKLMDSTEGAVNFGFEAEKVHEELAEDGIAMKLAHETGYKKEYDGSLGSEGFELISPVLPLFNQQVIDESISPVRELLNADTNDRCGGHINISKNGFNSRDILKAVKGSLPILYMIYEKRMGNRYCEAKKFSTYLRRPQKYSACYLKNNSILEVRLFPAIKNTSVLQNRIELMRMIMGELYGKSAIKVLLELANPTTNLHNFILNRLLNGSRDKMINKIKMFVDLSERYGCGKISMPTKKKINKLMQSEIFNIPVPVAQVTQVVPEVEQETVQTTDENINVSLESPTDAYDSHYTAYMNSNDYLFQSTDNEVRDAFVTVDEAVTTYNAGLPPNELFSAILDRSISSQCHIQREVGQEHFDRLIREFTWRFNDTRQDNTSDERVKRTSIVMSLKTFFIAKYFLTRIDISSLCKRIQGIVRVGDEYVFYLINRDENGNVVGMFGERGEGIQWKIEKRQAENSYRLFKLNTISID